MFKIFQIEGDSLYPIFKENTYILCIKKLFFMSIKEGDFVVFTYDNIRMIKQVKEIKENRCNVKGTSVFSVDSRTFGDINLSDIHYKVIYHLDLKAIFKRP